MRQTFRFRRAALILLTLFAIPGVYGDVTLRYKIELKHSPNLPPQMMQQSMNGIEASIPTESLLQFKNGKGLSSSGNNISVTDFNKQEITLLDKEGKRYATFAFSHYADELAGAMPQMPDMSKAAAPLMKPHLESRATGRTATIQGIEGEEHEIVVSMDGPPQMSTGGGPMMRMVMHFWIAKAGEAMRVPAVREVAGYNIFAAATMNPMAMLQKMFQQMPGLDFVTGMTKELQSSGTMVVLRSQVEMFMPMLASMMKQMGGADLDPAAPIMQMNEELAEISTATLPDSLFQVPEGYQTASAADIFRGMIKKAPAAGK